MTAAQKDSGKAAGAASGPSARPVPPRRTVAARLGPFLSLSRAMALGMARDRAAVFFMLLFPLMFLLLFGALFKDSGAPQAKVVQVGGVAVLDELPGSERERLREVLRIDRTDDSGTAMREALDELRAGDTHAVVFQRGDEVVLRVSVADQVRAGTVQGLLNSVVQQANQAATGQPPAFRLSTGQVEDESVQAIQFLTPGLLGWAVAMGAVFSTAITLVGWRRKRVLRRLRLAPVGATSVISAQVGTALALALVQTALFLSVASLPFYGLRLSGSWWLVVPLVMCGTLAFLSIGLVIGAWARTEEAANGAAQLVVLPMAFLSGAFIPFDAAPEWLRTIAGFMPLKYLAEAMQGVMSRGEGWGTALPVMGGLLLFAAVLTAVARWLFRWNDA
ncbi:ABC transporter permease [Streptomyces sp. 549]|uniref:ABC transporter permease n=1 Tax=Streptomyces sp. 549 TaxID=3049076 RepID=UPI0024C45AE7|nr:ABC transporter permease [Streptomyces sp. 549]MDK1474447.1 ABC transporter permease [Streptomyces sp. 549]